MSILIGQQGKRKSRKSLAIFIVTLVVGLLFATTNQPVTIFLNINYSSFIVIGVLVAVGINLPSLLLFVLVAVYGFAFGYLNGTELSIAASPVLFGIGVVSGYLLILLWIVAATLSFKKDWFQIGLRVIGSWVAAIGLLLIGLYF
jgi:urease accessory protein